MPIQALWRTDAELAEARWHARLRGVVKHIRALDKMLEHGCDRRVIFATWPGVTLVWRKNAEPWQPNAVVVASRHGARVWLGRWLWFQLVVSL